MQVQENTHPENVSSGDQPDGSQIEVQIERFPVARPKFSKESWDSGEGAGEG